MGGGGGGGGAEGRVFVVCFVLFCFLSRFGSSCKEKSKQMTAYLL